MQVQKWIIGKKIPKPTETLLDLNVRQTGHTVFLYLLSGKTVGLRRSDTDQLGRSHAASVSSTASGSAGTRVPLERAPDSPGPLRRTTSTPEDVGVSQPSGRSERLPTVQDSPPSSFSNHEQLSGPTNLPQKATIGQLRDMFQQLHGQGDPGSSPGPQGSFVNNLLAAQPAAEERPRDGWACAFCTFINQPTRPGCEMCSADRPQGYVVPDGASLDERERQRIAEEERSEALFQQVCFVYTNVFNVCSLFSLFAKTHTCENHCCAVFSICIEYEVLKWNTCLFTIHSITRKLHHSRACAELSDLNLSGKKSGYHMISPNALRAFVLVCAKCERHILPFTA